MAELKIDTTQAQSNLRAVDTDLKSTKKELDAAAASSDSLGKSFENTGKAAETMNGGLNAADEVLKAVGDSAGKVGGFAGDAVKQTLPMLQKALKGTTLSFKALGTAIAATGLGLLVQAVSYLITNFQEVTTWVGNFKTALGNSMPTLTRFIDKVMNFTQNISNWFKNLAARFAGTRFAKWLGLDKIAERFNTIRDAARQATEATNATADAVSKVGGGSGGKGTPKVTRNQADPIEQISTSNALTNASNAAARVSTNKQTIDDVKVLTEESKKYAGWLKIIKDLLKEEGDEAEKAGEKMKNSAQSLTTSIASISGSLAGMVEENSAAYKALMTVQVIATTAAGSMTAFTATDNISMAAKWASFAAILAAGAAQLKALYSNKLETKTVTAVTPTLAAPMTGMQQAAAIAQVTSTNSTSQVFITEQQLVDADVDQVNLKKNTVF